MDWGGQFCRAAAAQLATGSPTSRRKVATGTSFVKLQRPFAVMSILAPRRTLRSKTRQPIFRSAATAAANMPAAPPPTIANGTGSCFSFFGLSMSLQIAVLGAGNGHNYTKEGER